MLCRTWGILKCTSGATSEWYRWKECPSLFTTSPLSTSAELMLIRWHFEKPLKLGSWFPRELTWWEGWNFQPHHTPNLWDWERGWRLSSITSDQWFNQLCLRNEASVKTLNYGVQIASGLVSRNSSTCWAGSTSWTPQEWRLPYPGPVQTSRLIISSSGCPFLSFNLFFLTHQQ